MVAKVKTTKSSVKKTTSKIVKKEADTNSPATLKKTSTKVENETVDEVTVPSLSDDYNNMVNDLMKFRSHITALTARVRNMKTRSERELKQAIKDVKKRKSANRSPSGFVKPAIISNELADFVGKPYGSEMARTEVTRVLTAYIREHKLQDPKNGRIIIADAKLSVLLKLNKTDELTYFNLQRHMSPHFPKKKVVPVQENAQTVEPSK
jgi:chromatin remodeling complex protein RSC6